MPWTLVLQLGAALLGFIVEAWKAWNERARRAHARVRRHFAQRYAARHPHGLQHEPHPHMRNVNREHAQSMSLNDHIANAIGDHVGTMWFCYGLALLMLVWSITMIVFIPALHGKPPDPYPFAFLFFLLGGVMQSLLMPLLMVAQNLQSRHSERRAEADFEVNIKAEAETQRVLAHLSEQDALVSTQTGQILAEVGALRAACAQLLDTLAQRQSASSAGAASAAGRQVATKRHARATHVPAGESAPLAPSGGG